MFEGSKVITNPIQTKSAHLIWQSPLGAKGSRRRLPVAILRAYDNETVTSFEYLHNTSEFEQAKSEGFDGYLGIPLDREDTSDAVNTLGRRLLSPERPDYADYLARSGLTVEHKLSTLSLLAYTGAKLTSDSFSVSDTFEGFDRPFEYIFEVAGRRHYTDLTPSPQNGDDVFFIAEPNNARDPNAIAMVDSKKKQFGYVNACQAEVVGKWLLHGSIKGHVFRENGRAAYPRLFVFATVVPRVRTH